MQVLAILQVAAAGEVVLFEIFWFLVAFALR
jgi:hypothetical protein